jgi:hypothetical protein
MSSFGRGRIAYIRKFPLIRRAHVIFLRRKRARGRIIGIGDWDWGLGQKFICLE